MLTEKVIVAMFVMQAIAVAMLLWEWYENEKRDRVCRKCGQCQSQIHPMDQPPGPGGRV